MSVENNIPKGWVETTLGEVINLIGGGTPKTTINEYWNGNIPWLSVVDFNNDNRWVYDAEKSITELGLQKSSTKLLKIDDIIISARGTVGAMAQLKKEMAFNQSCYGIREVENVSNIDFLFYLTKYSLKQINRNTYGAVFDTITTKTFNVINVNLPPLQEQKAIANILTAFDDKIALLQAQNKTLETTAQTIFKEWFGKHQIGDELPEGYTEVTLKEIIESANTGLDAIKRAPIVEDNTGIKCFRIQDASQKKKYGDWGNTKVEEKNYKKFQLLKGDILIARTGNSIGVNYLIKEDLCSVFNNGLIRLRTNSKSNYQFLNMIITSEVFKRHIQSIAYGTSTQPNMQINSLLSYEFVLPPVIKQKKFKELYTYIIEKEKINQFQIQTLKKTRDTLLPKLMSGQLRVAEFKN